MDESTPTGEPHPSGEVPPVDSTGDLPTEATPETPPAHASGAFQWARGEQPERPVNAVIAGPPVAPPIGNGFRDERPASHVRLVGMHARSVWVPAILFGVCVLAYIVTSIVTAAGLLGAGTDSYQFRTDWSASQCRSERGSVENAVEAYEAARGRPPTSSAQLVDAGLLDRVPTAYRVSSSGEVVARSPGPCSFSSRSEGDSIQAGTLSAIGVWSALSYALFLTLMWWLYRSYRSLPPGRRHFSALWGFGPLLWIAAAVGLGFFRRSLIENSVSGSQVDNFALALTFLVCYLALWYLYGGIVRRIGTMFEVMGDHFSQSSWFGTIIRAYGTTVLLLIPVGAVCIVLALANNRILNDVVLVIAIVYIAALVVLYFATIVAVLCGVVVVTLGHDRAMKEHAALMTDERLDHIDRQRALSEAMAGARAAPITHVGRS